MAEKQNRQSRHRILFIPLGEERGNIDKTHRVSDQWMISWSSQPKYRVRESIMQGEGISTPHIRCTQREPFGLVCCLFAYLALKR